MSEERTADPVAACDHTKSVRLHTRASDGSAHDWCAVCGEELPVETATSLLREIRDMLKEQYVCGHGVRGFCPFCLKSERPG